MPILEIYHNANICSNIDAHLSTIYNGLHKGIIVSIYVI